MRLCRACLTLPATRLSPLFRQQPLAGPLENPTMTDDDSTAPFDIAIDVDAKGLNCPQPILRAKKALATLASGQLIRVTATDTGSLQDFQAFARQTGNTLLAQTTENGVHCFILRRR